MNHAIPKWRHHWGGLEQNASSPPPEKNKATFLVIVRVIMHGIYLYRFCFVELPINECFSKISFGYRWVNAGIILIILLLFLPRPEWERGGGWRGWDADEA